MNLHIIAVCFIVLVIGMGTSNYAFGQIDPLTEINFLNSGIIHSDGYQFHISSDINIREFFNGHIIRISGQTIEGFPYITYTKIINDEVSTFGKIFINGEFVKLSFVEKLVEVKKDQEKNDDLLIVVKYPQTIFSKEIANVSMYIFDKDSNKQNDYYQKEGRLSNIEVKIFVVDSNNQEFYSSEGITNEFGFYETGFWIPDNYQKDTLSITIHAENMNSKSSKILQLFTLSNEPDSGVGCPSGTTRVNGVCV